MRRMMAYCCSYGIEAKYNHFSFFFAFLLSGVELIHFYEVFVSAWRKTFLQIKEKKKVKYNSRRKALNQRENESKNLPDVYLYSWQYSLRKLLAQTLFCFLLSMFSLEHDSINELERNFLFVSYSTFYFGW